MPSKVSKKELDAIEQKAMDNGYENLTKEEQRLYKYYVNHEDIPVNSDDYSDIQVDNLNERKAAGNHLDEVEEAALLGKKVDKRDKMLDEFVQGTNTVFMHHYSFDEDKVSFDISIHEPSIRERGLIVGKTTRYLDGVGQLAGEYYYELFYTLSLIRICGDEVPLELSDDSKMFAPQEEWIMKIGSDFKEWESRFRR